MLASKLAMLTVTPVSPFTTFCICSAAIFKPPPSVVCTSVSYTVSALIFRPLIRSVSTTNPCFPSSSNVTRSTLSRKEPVISSIFCYFSLSVICDSPTLLLTEELLLSILAYITFESDDSAFFTTSGGISTILAFERTSSPTFMASGDIRSVLSVRALIDSNDYHSLLLTTF